MRKPTLIAGIGNILMGDDGIGPRLARLVKKDFPDCDVVEFIPLDSFDLRLLADRERIVFLDALVHDHPEECVFMDIQVPPLPIRLSRHESGLQDLLGMLAVLERGPRRIRLFGMRSPAPAARFGISPRSTAKLGYFHERFRDAMTRWGIPPSGSGTPAPGHRSYE